jgi:hypothetical protein
MSVIGDDVAMAEPVRRTRGGCQPYQERSEMPRTRTVLTTTEQAIADLEALGVEMDKLRYLTRLKVEVNRVPCLYVQNPAPGAAALNEHIYAASKDGNWWFWWSWADRIAQDPAEAARIIGRALRAADSVHALGEA